MRSYYEENKEAALRRAREWHQNNKEKHLESSRKYRKNHREKHLESCRRATKKWLAAHPEYKRKWARKNPYKGRQYSQNRKSRLLEVGGEITAEEWEELLDFYGRKCLCCGVTEDETPIHLDHVVPISRNGKNVIENAQPLCKSCNSAKGTRIIDYRN
jgi:5-methylcytosine-specific restriction endonuclease McrA